MQVSSCEVHSFVFSWYGAAYVTERLFLPELVYVNSVYVDHDGYNAQPYHNELIGYIIILGPPS